MKAYPIAKINLGLNIVERRPDGYHNLQTVFYPVPIKDQLDIRLMDAGNATVFDCDLEITNIHIEGDVQENLVVRAYRILKDDYPTLPRLHAHLCKNIPTQAGMGGGSSDCAYMIRLLNESFNLQLTTEQMIQYAARLGADCPFFILSKPCYAEGIGERLTPIELDLSQWHIVVVRPDIPVPTREAFSRIHPQYPAKNCREVVAQPVETWRGLLTNDFEESVFALHPEIKAVRDELYKTGAIYAAMSGSGSALFGLFKEPPTEIQHTFPEMFTFVGRL